MLANVKKAARQEKFCYLSKAAFVSLILNSIFWGGRYNLPFQELTDLLLVLKVNNYPS
jgi:hypothetical protein